jgi:hypothetical protein
LDTIKYRNADFESLAANAIDRAIKETQQDAPSVVPIDQLLSTFLLSRGILPTQVESAGYKILSDMGTPLGFNLLKDFGGMKYTFFGNFTALRPETVIWRVKTLLRILYERQRIVPRTSPAWDIVSSAPESLFNVFVSDGQIWILITSNEDKNTVRIAIADFLPIPPARFEFEVFSLDDIRSEVETVGNTA